VVDRRALRILKSRYWSAAGWKDKPSTSTTDLAYGKAHRLLFDDVTLTHAEVNAWLQRALADVTAATVTDAFIASLSSGRLDLRSALASWVYGRFAKPHALVRWHSGDDLCRVCGHRPRVKHDLSLLSFERHQFGGVRSKDAEYIAFDLTELMAAPKKPPTDEDASIFRRIIDAAGRVKPTGNHADLNRAIKTVVAGGAGARGKILQTLAYCGVLEDPAHVGFAHGGMSHYDLNQAGRGTDIGYPLEWWRGTHGVNQANLKRLFRRFL